MNNWRNVAPASSTCCSNTRGVLYFRAGTSNWTRRQAEGARSWISVSRLAERRLSVMNVIPSSSSRVRFAYVVSRESNTNRLRKNPDFCFAPGRLVGIIVASLLDSVEVAADAVPRYSGSSALQLHFSRAARAGGPPAAANPRDGKYRAPQDLARVR